MGFKTGVIVGLAAGYYLGAKAGRERYEQINRWIDQVRGDEIDPRRPTVLGDTANLGAGVSSN